jgi:hypothetical protein
MDAKTGKLALRILRDLKAREAEYRADREEWYRSGDGRSPKWHTDPVTGRRHNYGGKGYGFPYCEHGSSLWTDYDNICGGCEGDYGTVYEIAVSEATERVKDYNERVDWVLSAPKSLSWDVKRDLIDWVCEPLK